MHYDKKHGPIYKSIEALDKMGMDIIETGDPDSFKKYLSEYDNTQSVDTIQLVFFSM